MALSLAARRFASFTIDLDLTRELQSLRTPALDGLATGVDWIGYLPQFVIIGVLIALTCWIAGWRREAVAISLAELSEGIVNKAVKWFVVRPRPDPSMVRVYLPLQDHTYPIGHAFSFLVVFEILSVILIARCRPTATPTMAVIFLVALVAVVSPVQMDMGAHWFSDVLAGDLLGAVDLFLLVVWYRRRRAGQTGTTDL